MLIPTTLSIFDDLSPVFGKLASFVRYESAFLETTGVIEVLLAILFTFSTVLDSLKDYVLG